MKIRLFVTLIYFVSVGVAMEEVGENVNLPDYAVKSCVKIPNYNQIIIQFNFPSLAEEFADLAIKRTRYTESAEVNENKVVLTLKEEKMQNAGNFVKLILGKNGIFIKKENIDLVEYDVKSCVAIPKTKKIIIQFNFLPLAKKFHKLLKYNNYDYVVNNVELNEFENEVVVTLKEEFKNAKNFVKSILRRSVKFNKRALKLIKSFFYIMRNNGFTINQRDLSKISMSDLYEGMDFSTTISNINIKGKILVRKKEGDDPLEILTIRSWNDNSDNAYMTFTKKTKYLDTSTFQMDFINKLMREVTEWKFANTETLDTSLFDEIRKFNIIDNSIAEIEFRPGYSKLALEFLKKLENMITVRKPYKKGVNFMFSINEGGLWPKKRFLNVVKSALRKAKLIFNAMKDDPYIRNIKNEYISWDKIAELSSDLIMSLKQRKEIKRQKKIYRQIEKMTEEEMRVLVRDTFNLRFFQTRRSIA